MAHRSSWAEVVEAHRPEEEEEEEEHRQEEEAEAHRTRVAAAEGERRTKHQEGVHRLSCSPYQVHRELHRGHQGRPRPKGGHHWLAGEVGEEYHHRVVPTARLFLLKDRLGRLGAAARG